MAIQLKVMVFYLKPLIIPIYTFILDEAPLNRDRIK